MQTKWKNKMPLNKALIGANPRGLPSGFAPINCEQGLRPSDGNIAGITFCPRVNKTSYPKFAISPSRGQGFLKV